ncbi:pyruvate dehydrogenase (acetyl-transferring) E1 component subunit alpha [Pseudenhygromyxa sp. WMMC2535]|uniref:thiamine pyrophosphate-dependent enzyme n=1 Tax=Pseudenhygromyxa sp. WMMC2535 TaxID=2712867 RepID=UPI001551A476|nr:thiamine pyrophosphate-dependent enzyme [Pseudenhygromyxa sp. WMMC2535]NVB42629.1 pyruvate dehydrogenase (acetyl-transferring) E1 component subunit alpha [Pseudenhygromyxa sp. WMMC2535]
MDNPETSAPLPETLSSASKDETLAAFREMLRIRRFEETAARAYTRGKISGFLHLYIGQEAIAIGTNLAMKPGDRIVSTYRDHGFALAQGCDPNACMAELFGKRDGLVGGVGGSMHFFDREKGLWGGYAIVGNHIPVAAGHAFASKYLGDGQVTICFLGDGAVGIGPTHEGMTLAGLWGLPVVFVVENNRYSMGTPLKRTLPVEDITSRAPGYGMAGDRFEVSDPFQVRARLGEAIDRARSESKPTLVEILTYRFRGHSMSDPAKYRGKSEVEAFRASDPMELTRRALIEVHAMSEDELEALDDEIIEEMDAAASFADESPQPDPEHRFRNIIIEHEGQA